MPDLSDLPDDLNELAHIAGHDPASARRNAAFEKLVPEIRRIAEQVARTIPKHLRQDCIDDAPSRIWQRIARFDKAKGSFIAWASVWPSSAS